MDWVSCNNSSQTHSVYVTVVCAQNSQPACKEDLSLLMGPRLGEQKKHTREVDPKDIVQWGAAYHMFNKGFSGEYFGPYSPGLIP
jgi:hypothetical protein